MRQPTRDLFLIHEAEHYLNNFKELIDNVLNHPYTLPENIDNYEMYKSFNDAYHKMTSDFYMLSEIFDGRDCYRYKDDLPKEFEQYKWQEWVCPSPTATIYSIANHDINECLRNIFTYKDHTKHHLNFTKFWNDTLKQVCEMFIDWINDTEHITTFRQNRYDSLKENSIEDRYRKTTVWNFPGTKWWKIAIIIDSEEKRIKTLEEKYNELNEYTEALKTTQHEWFYKNRIERTQNHIDALEGKISPEYSLIYVLNTKENEYDRTR